MSDNDGTTQAPGSLTFEAIGFLANHPLAAEPDEPGQVETYANEITTNIIKDASKVASENIDDTNELNFPQTSNQIPSENNTSNALDKSEYSTTNGIHDENDFDHEDIQNKMNGVINEMRSRSVTSVDGTNIPRKSVISNRLTDDEANKSTPIIRDPSTQMDPSSNNALESPLRSMSESALVDHHSTNEQPLLLPVRQDESSSDADDLYGIKSGPTNTSVPIDDFDDQHRQGDSSNEQENHTNSPFDGDDFFNTKTATIDDDQRPSSVIKENVLDETTRFGTASPKSPPSRVQSAASKRSVRDTPDEPSTSGDEKRTQMSPTKLPDDTENDTDRDNQEVATIARRPSRALSPLNRPRSPTPNDSRKASFNIENSPIINDNRTISPTLNNNQQDEEEQKQQPTDIIAPSSRRESTNKNDQQQTSRPTSAVKTKLDGDSFEPTTNRPNSGRTGQFSPTDEQSKLITSGEQLQVPTDIDAPSSRRESTNKNDQQHTSRPTSAAKTKLDEPSTNRPSSSRSDRVLTTEEQSKQNTSDEHVQPPTDIIAPSSRRESTVKTDQQQTSRPTSAAKTKLDDNSFELSTNRPSSSRTDPFSTIEVQSKQNTSDEQVQPPTDIMAPSSRRESAVKNDQQRTSRPTSAVKTKLDGDSFEPTTNRRSSSEQPQSSTNIIDNDRLNSPPSVIKSVAPINPLLGSSLVQTEKAHSRSSSATNRKSPTPSVASNEKVLDGDIVASTSRRESTISQKQTSVDDKKSTSRRESQVIEQKPKVSSSPRPSSTQPQEESDTHREQQAASRRTSNAPQEQTSHRESLVPEQQTSSRRESIALEQKAPSRKEGSTAEQQISSRRESSTDEQKAPSRKDSTTIEQHAPVKRASFAPEQQTADHRESITDEQKVSSRRESTADNQKISSKRGSTVSEQKIVSQPASTTDEPQDSSRRRSVADEQKSSSRRGSITDKPQISSKRESTVSEQQTTNRKESIAPEQKPSSRRESAADEQTVPSRRGSITDKPQVSSKRESTVSEQQTSNRKESTSLEQKDSSRRGSTASEQQAASKKGSSTPEQQISSRRESSTDEQKPPSRKDSTTIEQHAPVKRASFAPDQQAASRRESYVVEQQSSDRRQSLSDQQEQKLPSEPVSRKTSLAEQTASRRESQQQSSTSRRTSTNRDNELSSPRHSNGIHVPSSQESNRRDSYIKPNDEIPQVSSRRASSTKQEQQPTPVLNNQGSRRSSLNVIDTNHQQPKHRVDSSRKEVPSSDTDVPIRTSAKHKREKSLASVDDNDKQRSPLQRRSGQQSKRDSNLSTDETVVTPIIMNSSKAQQRSGKRASTTDSDYEHVTKSKLPPVNSSFQQQEKPRHSDILNKQQIPISNRSEIKQISSSPSEDGQPIHWTKQLTIPSLQLTDDEVSSPREDYPRPQSPNVEQIAERNQPSSPSPPIITSTGKQQSATDGQKRKGQRRPSGRSTSADSTTHIRLVDDNSLDSTSENNTDFNRHKRRTIKPKKKDVETNTDRLNDSQYAHDTSNISDHQQQQQRSLFDEQELSSQKPLKATKPMSDHLHSIRRRPNNKEQILTTPDSDTPAVRRTVVQSKDSNQDKEPVNVNVTVVVKKYTGTGNDESPRTTAEAFVEQKPQQYFETVQQQPAISPPTATENNNESEEPIDRPKSTEQPRIKSSEQLIEHHDRHTQSDTEQIITEKQKKHRRPKRISRTSQTYECVFRRMEREQQHDLRATSDTEKNIQTRKSQLRPRKRSPKKNLPLYLSADSFKIEEVLPKQFHQSRRNISKSSSIARSLSPQGGKLLILRPTLPFHHTDAVNVQRICLQYAIDLIPNDNITMSAHRNKLNVLKQPEQTHSLPMISGSSSAVTAPTNKSHLKEKSASNKSEEHTHQRKNGGAV